jgi:hypothetical protein
MAMRPRAASEVFPNRSRSWELAPVRLLRMLLISYGRLHSPNHRTPPQVNSRSAASPVVTSRPARRSRAPSAQVQLEHRVSGMIRVRIFVCRPLWAVHDDLELRLGSPWFHRLEVGQDHRELMAFRQCDRIELDIGHELPKGPLVAGSLKDSDELGQTSTKHLEAARSREPERPGEGQSSVELVHEFYPGRYPHLAAAIPLPLEWSFVVISGLLPTHTPDAENGRDAAEIAGRLVVTPAGFEPAISTLKGSRPGPG